VLSRRVLQQRRELINVRFETLAFGIYGRVCFEQQFAIDPGDLDGSLTMRTGVPTGINGNSAATSSGYIRMQPCVTASPTAIGLLVPWIK